jgi:hypothetical protein
MSARYTGLPAAASVEQSIIFAQLELLRRLDPTRVATAKAARKDTSMYSAIRFLGVAGLLAASTAHSQAPQSALLNRIPAGHSIAREVSHGTGQVETTPSLEVAGERALLGRIEHRGGPTESTGTMDTPTDGARALLSQSLSAASAEAGSSAARSSFLAEVRGDVVTSASGDAEFGAIPAANGESAYTLSLGARGEQSAILFTRRNGAPLEVGRYRISDGGNRADEILVLVMTGSASRPTGVFRGRSGWLVVTAASDHVVTGRFQVDGVGFLAAEPAVEDRSVNVIGSFSATG